MTASPRFTYADAIRAKGVGIDLEEDSPKMQALQREVKGLYRHIGELEASRDEWRSRFVRGLGISLIVIAVLVWVCIGFLIGAI